MKFANISKIAKLYHVGMIGTAYGSYNANLDKLGKKGIWIAVNDKGELKVSKRMLGEEAGNFWLDKLASDWANGRIKEEDIF